MRSPLGDICYRQDSKLVALEQFGNRVHVRFADGYETSGDFLIAADGVNSECRAILISEAVARYAGYVAWRGLERETDLPEEIVQELTNHFMLYHSNGMQMLCYSISPIN